jgi:hypothetical protein
MLKTNCSATLLLSMLHIKKDQYNLNFPIAVVPEPVAPGNAFPNTDPDTPPCTTALGYPVGLPIVLLLLFVGE